MHVALENLMSDDTVDSSEYIQISDLDSPPVITFCPRQKLNSEKVDELGYYYLGMDIFTITDILIGKIRQCKTFNFTLRI